MAKKTDSVTLEGALRAGRGKQAAKQVRQENLIPGVVYGEKEGSLSIQVAAKELHRALHTKAGENVLINLRLKEDSPPKGKASSTGLRRTSADDSGRTDPTPPVSDKREKEMAVLIKELQLHPVSHHVIHVDFHRVSLTKRITVTVPLSFKGEPEGVRLEGGLLEHLRWDLEVECLPTEIPSEIPVDVFGLKVGQTLFAKEIPLPTGVRLTIDPELPVAACVMPKAEEAPAPATAEEAAAAEPEVIKQKKPEEIAAEEAAKEEKKEKEKAVEGKEKGEKSATGRGGSAT